MIAEILEEDESRVRWSHDNGKTWEYADIDELIYCWEEKHQNNTLFCSMDATARTV